MIRMSNEIKAGLVVLMGILIGVFFFAKTASFKQATYDLTTYFVYAGDLKPNAIVKLSGIEVGRLKDIKFIYDKDNTKVECLLEIDANAKVRKDSLAYIGTAGFVGDAFIGITPGESPVFAENGTVIASEDPVQTRLLMKKIENISENLDGILTEIKSVVTDNRPAMDAIITNMEATTENFKEFSTDVKKHPWKLLFKGE